MLCPWPACQSVLPSLVRSASTLPCASPVKIRPESVVSTPAPAPFGAEFVAPLDLAGLIVDGFEHALAPDAVIGAGPSERAVGGLGEVDAVARVRAHDEQAGLRVEAGRAIVGEAAFVGRDEASIGSGILGRIRESAALFGRAPSTS